MPQSIRYYNQVAPFWEDFVTRLEEQGSSHPWFANRGEGAENNEGQQQSPPWTEGWAGFPWGGPFPHRGRHGHGPHHHVPPPPPPPPDAEKPSPGDEKDPEAGPSEPRGPPPPSSDEPPRGPPRHGHGGSGGRGGRCGRGGRAGFPGRGRGAFGGFPGAMGGFGGLAEAFQNQLFGENANKDSSEDFKPEVDVFDTAESFVVHVSLPGAKKEDVGVNWDAEKSELSIAGVVYRPGDEEFLKTLAMDERKVGAFERKVRLGSRANPAQVDVEAITARMEDGVLRIEVPKLDSGYVEIKKVDID